MAIANNETRGAGKCRNCGNIFAVQVNAARKTGSLVVVNVKAAERQTSNCYNLLLSDGCGVERGW